MDNNQAKTPESCAGGTPEPPVRRRRSLRLQRIDDYLRAALANADPLLANLGAVNSDLMIIAYRLRNLTKAAFGQSSGAQANLGTVLPAIGVWAHIARQIQRIAELECRMRASQGTRPTPRPFPWAEVQGEENGT